jgi:hypothetical protein
MFFNFNYGVTGMAAYYAKNINLFLKEISTTPSKDELLYWGYFNYQSPTMALKWLNREGKSIAKGGSAWTKSQSQEDRPAGIPAKSLKRVSTARYLEENRFLEDDAVCSNPFFAQ